MLRAVHEMIGFAIQANDDSIGKIRDLYFDDEAWTVRYLIVDTGGWLTGRQVLISPISVGAVEWFASRIKVDLTREQVEKSPSIDEDKPVSRQHEADYFRYYNYPYYWAGPHAWGRYPAPGHLLAPRPSAAPELLDEGHTGDVHLRSVEAVTGYDIEADDGKVGHVEGFALDDETWSIRYLIVDTRNWLPGKKVLVSPRWIESVDWSDSRVRVHMTVEAIKECPEFDPHRPIDRDYEERIHRHYDAPFYWVP